MDQAVPWIVESALPDHAEALARRTAKNNIDVTFADEGMRTDIAAINIGCVSTDGGTPRKIEFVSCGVYWIVLNGREHRKTSLLESER